MPLFAGLNKLLIRMLSNVILIKKLYKTNLALFPFGHHDNVEILYIHIHSFMLVISFTNKAYNVHDT